MTHSSKRSLLTNKVFISILLVCAIFLGVVEFSGWKKRNSIEKEVNSLTEQSELYEKKNKEISESLAYLHSTAAQERVAREQLNMKKEGEIVVNFPDAILSATPIAEQDKEQHVSNASQWWNYFFGHK